jgi:hypothetical protein
VRTPTTAPVVATGLVGGFAIAKYSGRREFGGLFYAACGAWSARQWARRGGAGLTLGLGPSRRPRGSAALPPVDDLRPETHQGDHDDEGDDPDDAAAEEMVDG